MIQLFAKEQKINIKWIYLESCHGKGFADGIGATVENAIKNIVLLNPDSCIYTGFQNNLPSIQLHTYNSADIDKVNKLIPRLNGVVGTMKLHKIFVQYENAKIKTFVRNNSTEQAWQITMKTKRGQMPTKKGMHKSEVADSDSSSSDHSSNGILFSFSAKISREEAFKVFIGRA